MRFKTIYAAIYLLASASTNSAFPVPARPTSYNPLGKGAEPVPNTQFSENGLFSRATSDQQYTTDTLVHTSGSESNKPDPSHTKTQQKRQGRVFTSPPHFTSDNHEPTIAPSASTSNPYKPAVLPSGMPPTARNDARSHVSPSAVLSVADLWPVGPVQGGARALSSTQQQARITEPYDARIVPENTRVDHRPVHAVASRVVQGFAHTEDKLVPQPNRVHMYPVPEQRDRPSRPPRPDRRDTPGDPPRLVPGPRPRLPASTSLFPRPVAIVIPPDHEGDRQPRPKVHPPRNPGHRKAVYVANEEVHSPKSSTSGQ
ncbi:hypothetical protein DACRYDRAFT_117355 [Dacryopinax primogenitus]|uniref:Uncharacterized protein n=1 Tax=Dacryopinax primogenitus (strain DJM 731) TaxID=1858805 RepID=M5FVL1_DACPD|nr:uncharacterized protein DACRYDRAFT_117355 [Dacryopinax primogenitus]EJU00349.1 hypothetical protein DACRYDRAFT_117355 [Dacryopinax primogenitus]